MRDRCPVCLGTERLSDWQMKFLVPDGWTLPAIHDIYFCKTCGMIYHDVDATQEDYDIYYRTRYGFDAGLNNFAAFDRMDDSAMMVRSIGTPLSARIVDFGGGAGYLEGRLRSWRYQDVTTCNVGDDLPDNIDVLVSTQVFEHLLDLHGTLRRLIPHMAQNGRFVIEIPEAFGIAQKMQAPLLDYHQKHINHFGPAQLDLLFSIHGYERQQSEHTIADFFGGLPLYRAVYARNAALDAYSLARAKVTTSVQRLVEQAQAITEPVIVWGCGDICLHVLAQAHVNVSYFVDLDPAYRGEAIGGIPIYDRVSSDEPILVIAQNQRSSILKSIQDAGLQNKVVTIV